MTKRRASTNTSIHPATEAAVPRNSDPHELDQAAVECALAHIYANLPIMPVYDGQRLPPALPASDGVDRISGLPRQIRGEIVSRLPVKDAARTAVLSSRWRTIWLCTPLILIDVHLVPKGQAFPPMPANSPAISAAVSSILEAHPGLFLCVHLVCSEMNSYRPQLARWLQLFAAKGVQDLVLVNRSWPPEVPLPNTIFAINTLVRLYLGLWKLPDTEALRGAYFPHLRELGICCVQMEHGLIDSLVARSPVLRILNILGCFNGLSIRLISQSLWCIQVHGSIVENIDVVKAPRLERFILNGSCHKEGELCTRIRIGDAPKLQTFGFFETGRILEVRDNIIMPGIRASIGTMITTLTNLSLSVRFRIPNDVKMIPVFLRCFPNVEILHILSERCDKLSDELTLSFWEEFGPIEDSLSRINVMSFREYKGEPSEVAFLDFIFGSARLLKTATIVMANPIFTDFSMEEAVSKLKKCSKSRSCKLVVLGSSGPEGGSFLSFKTAADFSSHDPFSSSQTHHVKDTSL